MYELFMSEWPPRTVGPQPARDYSRVDNNFVSGQPMAFVTRGLNGDFALDEFQEIDSKTVFPYILIL